MRKSFLPFFIVFLFLSACEGDGPDGLMDLRWSQTAAFGGGRPQPRLLQERLRDHTDLKKGVCVCVQVSFHSYIMNMSSCPSSKWQNKHTKFKTAESFLRVLENIMSSVSNPSPLWNFMMRLFYRNVSCSHESGNKIPVAQSKMFLSLLKMNMKSVERVWALIFLTLSSAELLDSRWSLRHWLFLLFTSVKLLWNGLYE